MRKMLTKEEIAANAEKFKKTFSRFLRFDDKDGAIMVNNADWLLDLKYIEFIRDYGRFFSVNRMLIRRMFQDSSGKGLTFLEFTIC